MLLFSVYRDANVNQPSSYWDYENAELDFNPFDKYKAGVKIGRGKYSNVYTAINTETGNECVIKRLKPVKEKKINREVMVLRSLQGGPNIIDLYDVCKSDDGEISFIFEKVENEHYKTLLPKLTDYEVRFYIYQVLKALDYAHSRGIIHRDIKPLNIVFDRAAKKLRLIDWGLAEFYHPNKEYNLRVASRHYKAPELLVGYRRYDYSLDMWSLGTSFAGIIFQIIKFFHGSDNPDQLVKIAQVLGTEDLYKYNTKYGVEMEEEYEKALGEYDRVPWNEFITEKNKHLANPEAIDLLDKLLVYDHQLRLTAKEAMDHPYFNPVRDDNTKADQLV